MAKAWLLAGAILGASAVGAGAFGAHALRSRIVAETPGGSTGEDRRLEIWDTAARYQMHHALALIGLGLLCCRFAGESDATARRLANIAGVCFLLGVFAFSGSLYVLVFTKLGPVAVITPFGGLLLIAGWLIMAGAICAGKTIRAGKT